eukprot:PhM_4_TR5932/c0_g1_i1/m.84084
MTRRSVVKDMLMFLASFRVLPDAPLIFTRSLPARSTRLMIEIRSVPRMAFLRRTQSWKMAWLRLLWSFIFVDAVERYFMPLSISCRQDSSVGTFVRVRPSTNVPTSGWCRTLHSLNSFSLPPLVGDIILWFAIISRSFTFSLYISMKDNSIVVCMRSDGTSWLFAPSMASNSSATTRGATPGWSSEPNIVKVFPDPVWPYAKMQALKPVSEFFTVGAPIASNTSACDLTGTSQSYAFCSCGTLQNMWSNSKASVWCLPEGSTMVTVLLSTCSTGSILDTSPLRANSRGMKGRTRSATAMFWFWGSSPAREKRRSRDRTVSGDAGPSDDRGDPFGDSCGDTIVALRKRGEALKLACDDSRGVDD